MITLREAATHCRVTRETVRQWVVRGVWAGQQLHRLEARWVAGRWLTKRR